MKKWNRIVALITVLMLCAAVIVGCNKKNTQTNGAGSSNDQNMADEENVFVETLIDAGYDEADEEPVDEEDLVGETAEEDYGEAYTKAEDSELELDGETSGNEN